MLVFPSLLKKIGMMKTCNASYFQNYIMNSKLIARNNVQRTIVEALSLL